VWWTIAPDRALWIAVSVIVVTCPCALSLATPGVMSAAIGQLAKFGMLVTRGSAIENLANVTHIVFDKTGTLTFGKLKVLQLDFPFVHDAKKIASYKNLIALMANMSLHPVSKAIADYLTATQAQQIVGEEGDKYLTVLTGNPKVENHVEHSGSGIEIQANGRIYRLGQLNYVKELNASTWIIPSAYADKTVTVFGDEEQILACFVLEDKLRDEAVTAIAELQKMGKKIVLLSGDRQEVVADIAAQCHISDYHAGLSPAQKHQYILELQQQAAVVAMVGDGMNDGPALSLANVSVAMGQGAPISQTRSDCLLMSNRLSDLSFSLKLSNQSFSLIRQNLGWALLYNVIAIPAAVMGYLEPWHAALGMSLSSLLVVLNGLRVLTMRPPDYDLPMS